MQKPLTFFVLFLFSNFNFAADFFVSTTGSNLNSGSILNPFATIQYALSVANPGDIVQVREGTYFEKIMWPNSGTFSNKITLTNYNNEIVKIDGTGVTGFALLNIQNISFIEVNGFIFQNNYLQDAKGIYVFGEGKSITINNCTVKNMGWTTNVSADPFAVTPNGQAHGILINGRTSTGITDLKISNCSVHHIITGNSEALTVAGNVDDFEIVGDSVYNNTNIGIVATGHYSWAVDVGVDPTLNQARNGRITNCVAFDNRRFSNLYAPAGIYVDGGKNIKLFNNICYKNGNGMFIGCENAGFSAENIIAMNNIIYNNDNNGCH